MAAKTLTGSDPVTDEHVRAAEQEAAEAEQLVQALEQRVIDGDEDVTPDQIASARELGRFAQLRTEATRRKAAKAKEAARLAAIAELADDVRAHDVDQEAIVAAVDEVDQALRKLIDLTGAHNERVAAWRVRCAELEVPASPCPDGGLSCPRYGGGVEVGGKQVNPIPAGSLVSAVVHRVGGAYPQIRHQGRQLDSLCPDFSTPGGPVDLRAAIRGTVQGGQA
ncbi:hypothetical protein ACWEU6_05165 [Streptosporangium sandarakinum]|uniref:hypothetical protein n=1 Tax=Streptosporangium sandarakinum TaxID=1260955 RepID=UPI0036B7C6D8